jgi:hypothetical protein
MNKAARVILPIWTIVMFLFFFVPMGGSTGFEAVMDSEDLYPKIGALVAGIGGWIGLLALNIKQWLRR